MKNLLIQILTIRKIYILAIFLIIAASLAYFFWPSSKTESINLAQVKRGEIKETISASGTLTGKFTATLKFKTAGKLAVINYKVGDSITKGEPVASLDSRDLQIALQQARNDYNAKQAAAQKAEDDVKGHDKDETFAQKKDRTAAQATQNSAYDAVKAAELAIQNSTIYAPISGTITQANPLPGQIITSSDTIVEIVDWSEVFFEAEIDESDISKISTNQIANISLDSYPDNIFHGSITEIVPQTQTTSSGATVVLAKIKLGTPSIHLIKGLNGTADIIINQSSNTLFIPQSALINDDTVLIPENQNYKQVKVKTGLKSDDNVEIISGLSENDQVITNPEAVKISR